MILLVLIVISVISKSFLALTRRHSSKYLVVSITEFDDPEEILLEFPFANEES